MALTENQMLQLLTMLRIRNSERDLQRIPLDAEQRMLEQVRQGRPDDLHVSSFAQMRDNLGEISNDTLKQFTYITVSCITLTSRAALEGGALPDDVFDLADAFLFALGYAQTLEDIQSLYQLAPVMMARLVAAQKDKPASFQIDRAKNYISKHIFHRITLEEIADYAGISPQYLSALFSKETGMTLHNYIQKEKIDLSCNLLKHTDRPVSDIALYMGFPTPSNFSAVFRKWIHMTPREYRQQNFQDVY